MTIGTSHVPVPYTFAPDSPPSGSTASGAAAVPCYNRQSCSVPVVYQEALEAAERNGWAALHPGDHPLAWTVLHWAASEDQAEVCLRLLAARADPCCQDDLGRSALDCARVAGATNAWCVLAGAVAYSESARRATPVLLASPLNAMQTSRSVAVGALGAGLSPVPAVGSDVCSTRKLVKRVPSLSFLPPVYSAAVVAVETYGWQTIHGGALEWTAFHWAAQQGRADVCERLLRCQADPRQADHLGLSALDYARTAGHEATLRVLAEAPF